MKKKTFHFWREIWICLGRSYLIITKVVWVLTQGFVSWPLGYYCKSPHLIRMTIFVAKLQYFTSVKTLSVDSITWNSQNVNLMQNYQKKTCKNQLFLVGIKSFIPNCLVWLAHCPKEINHTSLLHLTMCITYRAALLQNWSDGKNNCQHEVTYKNNPGVSSRNLLEQL